MSKKMKKCLLVLLTVFSSFLVIAQRNSNYQIDHKYVINGEYRGRFCPPAEYVLSGKFAEDIGPLPKVPWHYNTAKEGYRQDVMSPVPAPGVHPRVLMSMSDIEKIREKIKLGDKAPRYFRIVLNWAQNQRKDLTTRSLMALINDDQEAGRKCVDEFMEKMKAMEPVVDILNSDPQAAGIRDNYWYYCRTKIVKVGGVPYMKAYREGGAKRIHELAKKSVVYDWEYSGQSISDVSDGVSAGFLYTYDYLHKFMTEEERESTRRVIKKVTYGRYCSGMDMPGHMFINNHQSMSYDLILATLCIEGQEGYDERVVREAAKALNNQLTYYISNAGLFYEKNKGFLPERALLAITRRKKYPLLSHSHLYNMVMAKAMDSVNVFWRYNEGRNNQKIADLGKGFEEPRIWYMGWASGPWMDFFFNIAFSMKFVYPEDPIVDYFYKSRLQSQGFGPPDADGKLPSPRIRYTHPELCLLMTCEGLKNKDDKVINYDKTGLPEKLTDIKTPWVDMKRGIVEARASWEKDALMVHYESRSDAYVGGHESPEAGDFNLYSDGIEWSGWRKWYLDAYFRNAVLIDGKAGIYVPTAAKLMEVNDTSHGVTIISDNTDQYNWRKFGKNMFFWAGVTKDAPKGWAFSGGTANHWKRDWEVPFQPHMREYLEGFGSLDWGGWHGENRGMEIYGRWNDVDHVFRTLHLAKGKRPYVLIVDDVRKDDQVHQYDWMMKLADDIVLWKGSSSASTRASGYKKPTINTTDLYLVSADTKTRRRNNYGIIQERLVQRGDPVLLVRVLHRNTNYEFPQPSYEKNYSHPRIKIPALAVDPEFRVLLYPHKYGDPIPKTQWNKDRTELSVIFPDQVDDYKFAKTERERTSIIVTRGSKTEQIAPALPVSPKLITDVGWQPDKNIKDEIREISFYDKTVAKLNNPPLTQAYRYTLDGSEPTADSPLYTKPVPIDKSLVFKAKAFADDWPFAKAQDKLHAKSNDSKTLTIQFSKEQLQEPVEVAKSATSGLKCEVFEIHHTKFDEKNGIFTGSKNMLPDLAKNSPLSAVLTKGAVIPQTKERKLPRNEMAKGYFRYTGFFNADKTGDYSFKLNSCGPVRLKIGNKTLINVLLPYGLSQKDRFGQVSLNKGWQKFEMTVCDPIFWQAGAADDYHISLSVMEPGSTKYVLTDYQMFRTTAKVSQQKEASRKVLVSKGQKLNNLKPGLITEWSLLDAAKPAIVEILPVPKDDPVAGKIVRFKGYIKIREPGIYEFITDGGGENELKIGGKTVCKVTPGLAQNKGRIELDSGLHSIDFAVTSGKSSIYTVAPNRTTSVAIPASFFCHNPSEVSIPTGLDYGLSLYLPFDEVKDSSTPAAVGNAKVTVGAGKIVEDAQRGKVYQPGKTNFHSYVKQYDLQIEDIPRTRYERSISLWFKPLKKGDFTLLRLGWHRHPVHYNQVNFYRGKLGLRGGAGSNPNLTGDVKINEWNHLVMVYKDGRCLWYLNGKYKGMMLGFNWPQLVLYAFCGESDILYDDLKIYDRPLSVEEVKELWKK